MARWEQHPCFQIYHYGAYETTAVKRLMSRYATREDEVDRLLRGRVFVDLHRVVRQGLRASVESYSLKALEPFHGFTRALDLATATRARVQVEARLESGDAAGVPGPLRAELEGYNRDDCLSTLRLAAWLEERRQELQALTGQPVPRPALRDEERDREQEPAVETGALFEALTAGLPADDAELDGEQRSRRLLAHLLGFHRREDKSMWWEFFHRCGFTEEEHVESRATLGALTYDGEAGPVKRSVIHRCRFPEQPHEIEVGDSPKNPATAESDELKRGFCGTVVALDETVGTIELKRARNSPVPHPAALVGLDNVQNTVLRESLARLAEAVVSGGLTADSPRRASFDLLGRVPPRIEASAAPANASGFGFREGLAAQGEAPLAAVRRIAPRLDHSVLPVQGPPGSGKTYTGARMILDLLAGGKRVGVTANSHKVISNLLAAVCEAADGPPVEVRGIQKANAGDGCPDGRIVQAGSNAEVAEALAGSDANLHAGNTNASAEEADCVAALIRELLDAAAACVDGEGVREPLTLQDVLVVAPYNAHVAVLRSTLPTGARVGPVGKLQGQEAPIVIYSMATSTTDEAPRGMEFLYSLHRLNVATSRARCVAAIVANPGLLTPDCRTPELRLANPFCRFLELAEPAREHAPRS